MPQTSNHTKTEILVGAFMMLGIAALAYLSVSIGGLEVVAPDRYVVRARFESVGDLKPGAPIRLAGVKIGQVASVELKDYLAETRLAIGRTIQLPKDTVASIRSEGLLGDTYVALTPGGSLENLREGMLLTHTEPAIDLSDLLARYAFGKREAEPSKEPASDAPGKDPFSKDPLQ
jgi:phospholipid/cholesterol/gamma-HCH transport system substrate-binding protein